MRWGAHGDGHRPAHRVGRLAAELGQEVGGRARRSESTRQTRAVVAEVDRRGRAVIADPVEALQDQPGGGIEDAGALLAAGEPAAEVLAGARAKLLARAARITDAAWRERFLAQVPDHARLLALAGDLGW
jgi:hypothetical protein